MKKILFIPLVMTLLTANMAFAADEIHWIFTGQNSVAFDWRGPTTENTIGYGLTSGVYTQVNATTPNPVPVSSKGPFWEANLPGLAANTRYYYKIGNEPERSFRTPPTPGSSNFNVYALGNIGSSSTYFNTGAVQDIIANDLPSFVVGLGDLTLGSINGKATIDQHFNDVMVWSKEAAYLPVWGDLEWLSSSQDSFKNYKGRFAVPNSQTSPGSPLAGGKDWYWFDYGNTRFITLPEPWSGAWSAWNTTAGDLMAQAQADPNLKFIATFGHQPAYSSGHYSGSDTLKGILDKLGDTYSKYTLNINGHSNNYERSLPQHGVTHVTVGTGGANLSQDGPCLWLTCAQPAWSAFRAMHLGALKLRFADSSIVGSFICGPAGGGKNDVNCTKGSVVDNFTIASPTVTVASSAIAAPMAATSAAALPDAIVTSLSYAKGIFKSVVKNQGTAATPVGVVVGVRYSVDGVGKTWGAVNGPLAAGASVTIGTQGGSYTIPTGTHTITAWVDDVKRFAESNKNNNTLTQTITIAPIDTQAPTVPTGLKATVSSSSQINLSWTASTDNVGVTGYKIFRNSSQVSTSTGTAFSDSGLIAATSYTYTVAAYDAAGNTSNNSAAVTATTTASTTNDYAIQGFAAVAGVTGGAGGQNIVVTNLNDTGTGSLKAALFTTGTRNITFAPGLTGIITWPDADGQTYVGSGNFTLDGTGAKITISGRSLDLFSSSGVPIHNVIIRNMTFGNTVQGRSAIDVMYGSYGVWIDHNTFYDNSKNDAAGGEPINIWNQSSGGYEGGLYGITISWNHFMAPNIKAILVGSNTNEVLGGTNTANIAARVSIHHNYFDHVVDRTPRVHSRDATVHAWNNYNYDWDGNSLYASGLCTAASNMANFLSENNIYEAVTQTLATSPNAYAAYPPNSLEVDGQYTLGGATYQTRGTFPRSKITYTYNLETANAALKTRIMQGAGAH